MYSPKAVKSMMVTLGMERRYPSTYGLSQATDAFCAAEGHCMDVLCLQGMSCKRWGGWERAMTAYINVCWYVCLVLLEYLIWSAVIVEAYPRFTCYHCVRLELRLALLFGC